MESQLVTLSNELASLAEKVAPSVVAIHGRRHTPSSGVHWRKDLIVTAEHTLRRDEDITVTLAQGESAKAHLVGRDAGTDIALLKVDGLNAQSADAGTAPQLRVGDIALVVGRSPNSGPNASMGIISAVSGPWRTWRGGELDQYIRLDANIFSGSSGGAVVDFRGAVVGIATSALSRVAGLAIPSSTVNRVVDWLLKKGSVPHGYIGVGLQPVPVPESFQKNLSLKNEGGLMVLSVEPDGPADKSGILVGDILLDIGDRTIDDIEDLQSFLTGEKVGKATRVKIIRGGELKEVSVTVGERSRKGAS
jgi:S1-C subfamily serine protease